MAKKKKNRVVGKNQMRQINDPFGVRKQGEWKLTLALWAKKKIGGEKNKRKIMGGGGSRGREWSKWRHYDGAKCFRVFRFRFPIVRHLIEAFVVADAGMAQRPKGKCQMPNENGHGKRKWPKNKNILRWARSGEWVLRIFPNIGGG